MGKATAWQTWKKCEKKQKKKPKCLKKIKFNRTKGLCSPKPKRLSRSRNGNQMYYKYFWGRLNFSLCFHVGKIKPKRFNQSSCRSSSVRLSRPKNRRTPRKSRANSCAPSSRSTKSGISHAASPNRFQCPSCGLCTSNCSSNAVIPPASSENSMASCTSGKTTVFGNQKTNRSSESCESEGRKRSDNRALSCSCSSPFSLPDQGEETESNRTQVSCGSIHTRLEKQNNCGTSNGSNQSDNFSDSCSSCLPSSGRNIGGQDQKSPSLPKISNPKQTDVEKRCGAKLKYQRCELSDEISSAALTETDKSAKDNQVPKFLGTFVLQPEKGKQLSTNATKFAGTVTFTSTKVSDSVEQYNEPGSRSQAKKKRIKEEADSANKNNYGRILTAHYLAATLMRSSKREDGQKHQEEDKGKSKCKETPKCTQPKPACRKSASSRRLAVKTAALAGYSYRTIDKKC